VIWYLLDVAPPLGSYAGPLRVHEGRGWRRERYRNLDTGRLYVLIVRPSRGPPRWFASEDPSA
jgi:hypothetical protein